MFKNIKKHEYYTNFDKIHQNHKNTNHFVIYTIINLNIPNHEEKL